MCDKCQATGVCVVRIEKQQSGSLLITVITNKNIHEVSGQSTTNLVNVDAALEVIRGFLADFTDDHNCVTAR